jgi:hypothetical protein
LHATSFPPVSCARQRGNPARSGAGRVAAAGWHAAANSTTADTTGILKALVMMVGTRAALALPMLSVGGANRTLLFQRPRALTQRERFASPVTIVECRQETRKDAHRIRWTVGCAHRPRKLAVAFLCQALHRVCRHAT